MIRSPISRRSRLLLGIAGCVTLLAAYTALAEWRQATRRSEQRAVAVTEIASLAAIDDRSAKQQADLEKWQRIAEQPDAVDRSIPTWGVLYREGWVRATSEQGSFVRKEIWLLRDFFVSGRRLFVGLLLGIICSVVIGILMGCFDRIEAYLLPPFALLAKVPMTGAIPVFLILAGTGFEMYIAMILAGMVPTLAQGISANVRKDVPEELIYKAYTLGASRFELIYEVIYKQVLPRMIDAIRLQIGPAIVFLIAAEWMAGTGGEGIGYRLRIFYQRADMTVAYVYLFLLSLFGLFADYGLIWLRRKLCPWFGE